MDRREVLISALRKASLVVMQHDPKTVEANVKSTAGDLVTAADLASEKVIIETIKGVFPEDMVISEEITEGQENLNETNLPNLTAWIIDPLDGTNNFKRNMGYFGISIGYVKDGEILLGGVIDPCRDEIYVAEAGKGVTCNNEPIQVSDKATFDAATRVCTSNSMNTGSTLENLSRYDKLGDVWVDVLGSGVLIMCAVAAGKLDLYHHNGLKPWDNAAGFLIAREAGAKIVNLHGQPVTWLTSDVVMANPELADKFLKLTA